MGWNRAAAACPVTQPQQCWVQATFATYASTCSISGSITHCAKSVIKPASLWTLCHVINPLSHTENSLYFCFIFFKAAPMAYWGSQARGQFRAVATGLHHSHSNTRSKLHMTYTTAHVNTGSLTHWGRQGMESASSKILSDVFPQSQDRNPNFFNIVYLQHCVKFSCTANWPIYIYMNIYTWIYIYTYSLSYIIFYLCSIQRDWIEFSCNVQ